MPTHTNYEFKRKTTLLLYKTIQLCYYLRYMEQDLFLPSIEMKVCCILHQTTNFSMRMCVQLNFALPVKGFENQSLNC